MTRRLRWLGIAGTLGVTGWLVLSALLRDNPQPPPPEDIPPGFEQQVGGLGQQATTVLTAASGPVRYMDLRRVPSGAGGTRLVPRVQVDGRDPTPQAEDWMLLADVVVTRYEDAPSDPEAQPRVLMEARAPQGLAPLRLEDGGIVLDRTRPLRVRNPVLTVPGVLDGRSFELVTEMAEMDPESGVVRCGGPFELTSAGMRLTGTDLFVDQRARKLRFSESAGTVQWEVTDQGLTYRGASDGGGFLEELEDGRQLLTLPARERCRMEFPARDEYPDFFPAVLEAHGAQLLLRRGDGGWRPERAAGQGPLRWSAPGLLAEGSECTALWEPDGRCAGLDVRGPLLAARAGEDPGFATARGGGWFAPEGDAAYLYDEASAWTWIAAEAEQAPALAQVRAGWLQLDGAQRRAGAGVFSDAPQLAALGERVQERADGSVLLEGDALVYPGSGGLRAAAAQRIERGTRQDTHCRGGFVLLGTGAEGGEDWRLEGEELDAEEQEQGLWVDARRNLELHRGGTIFRGDRLNARGQEYAALSGAPSTAEVPRPEGGAWRAEAQRFVQDQDGLLAQGAPVVRVPAAELGLAGAEVVIRSGALRYRAVDETWEWSRGVRFEGALAGAAGSATWREGGSMQLRGDRPSLEGDSADGAHFRMAADRLDIGADGGALLDGGADALLTRSNDEGVEERVHMQGERGWIERSGGWFEGDARAATGERTGRARRIEWTRGDAGNALLQFLGDAYLEGPEGEARGAQVNYDSHDPAARFLEMWGAPGAPAQLDLKEGRTVVGEWLRFDLETRLLSTTQGSFRASTP